MHKNRQGGIIQLIVVIIIALWLINFFGLSLTSMFNWVRDLFYGAL